MRPYLECVACGARQAVEISRSLNLPDEVGIRLVSRVLERLQALDWCAPPAVMGRDIHRVVRAELGVADPYFEQKLRATQRALELLPAAEESIAHATDPFYEAVRLSAAANVIDLGAPRGQQVRIGDVLDEALAAPLGAEAVNSLRQAVRSAESVLFLADNAGELVLDRPLLDRIGPDKVTVAVRGSPVLNDVTLQDAERSGVLGRYRLIDNGSDCPGTWLPDCSAQFMQAFSAADVVIAKGQGNYETLSDCEREVFFLLRAKCGPVAEHAAVGVGDLVLLRKPARDQQSTRCSAGQ